jgi:elongation factor Ts
VASTIEKIKQLREETAAGMMDVKRALEESGGDLDGARRILKERGQAIAAKKSARETNEGLIDAYIHFNGRVGVLVEVNCETDFVARTEEFRQLVRDIAMHIASMKPLVVRPEDIPEEVRAQERAIFEKQAAEMNKPEQVTRSIVEGKLKKWEAEQALMTQPFVKDPERTVGELVQEAIGRIGENITVRRFTRYEL